MTAHYLIGDYREMLGRLPAGSVQCCITDPPYDSLDKHRAVGTTTRLKKEWFETLPVAAIAEGLDLVYRALAKDTHCYVFCDDETRIDLVPLCRRIGFRYWKSLVWDKGVPGMGYHYRAQHEYILFLEKGKRRLNDLGVPDVLPFRAVRRGVRFPDPYPTQKPEELLSLLIQQSTQPGELVIDPWAGSGATLAAARDAGRLAVGFDISESGRRRWQQRVQLPVLPPPGIKELVRTAKLAREENEVDDGEYADA